jgi:hypothetical protein
MIPRIFASVILFLSVVFLPWPYVAGLSIIPITVFSWFLEAVFIGIILGVLHTFSKGNSEIFSVFFIASFILTVFVAECFKRFFEGRNIISYILIFLSGAASFVLCWFIFKILLEY